MMWMNWLNGKSKGTEWNDGAKLEWRKAMQCEHFTIKRAVIESFCVSHLSLVLILIWNPFVSLLFFFAFPRSVVSPFQSIFIFFHVGVLRSELARSKEGRSPQLYFSIWFACEWKIIFVCRFSSLLLLSNACHYFFLYSLLLSVVCFFPSVTFISIHFLFIDRSIDLTETEKLNFVLICCPCASSQQSHHDPWQFNHF